MRGQSAPDAAVPRKDYGKERSRAFINAENIQPLLHQFLLASETA